VQAIRDAPERAWQDLADIGFLLRVEGVDREEARGYFERAGLEEKWRELVVHAATTWAVERLCLLSRFSISTSGG
jgi:hypothetical protein